MRHLTSASALAALLLSFPAAAAQITVVVVDGPGVGFNDPTPAAPVGGNTGVTVGEQRLLAFQHAAGIWGASLDSAAEIRIQASFPALACTATTAVLGSAGAIQVVRDFPGAEYPSTWYHTALANKLAFADLLPGDPGTTSDDIRARFNANLGQPTCLAGTSWYYGLDTGHAANQINLVTVLLHEFAHGLGFSSFANVSTGTYLAGLSDVYSKFYFDDSLALSRDAMTDALRQASAVNPRNVSWTGPKVTSQLPGVLAAGTPLLGVATPPAVAGKYQVGAAAFGPQLAAPGVSGEIVAATDPADAAGATVDDACSAIDNGPAVAGKIALVDRGTCGFVVKVKNAQNAGAVAVIVADNAAGGPPAGLGGADPTITIPSVRVTRDTGLALRAALATGVVLGNLGVDSTVRAGADPAGRALLYTPNPVQTGSSVSHWDTIATPNQLMEPAINADLTLSVNAPQDLSRALMRDVGWYPDGDLDGAYDDAGDQCLGSDLQANVVIEQCDTGVPNTFFTNGCTIRDLVRQCQPPPSPRRWHHDDDERYERCVKGLTRDLRRSGFLTRDQARAIRRAVEHEGHCGCNDRRHEHERD